MRDLDLITDNEVLELEMEVETREYPVIPNPEGEPTEDITKMKIDDVVYGVKDAGVHDWARAEEKPSYTKAEVGLGNVDNTSDLNKPVSTATQAALDLKADSSSVYTKTESDNLLNGKVDKEQGKGLSTNDYTNEAKAIVDGVTSALDGKVDKVSGYGLSKNDYSDTDKAKLDGIEAEANKTIVDTEISATSTNPLQNKAIYDLLNDLLPEATETGNPISISNASGFNAKALTVDMLPIQEGSGTPSPDNIRPIIGRTSLDVTVNGKNLCETVLNYVLSMSGDSRVVLYNSVGTTAVAKCQAGVTYTVSGATGRNRGLVGYYDHIPTLNEVSVSDNTVELINVTDNGYTFTATYTGYALLYLANSVLSNVNIQVELGSSATTYEPYKLISNETLNFGQTVYGGTSDVVNGGTSKTVGFREFIGAENENWQKETISGNKINFYIGISDAKAGQAKSTSDIISCNEFDICDTTSPQTDKIYISAGKNLNATVGDSLNCQTVAEFKTWLSTHHLQVVYELATPTTISTPATTISLNKGNNTLSTSGDNMDLKYSKTPQ